MNTEKKWRRVWPLLLVIPALLLFLSCGGQPTEALQPGVDDNPIPSSSPSSSPGSSTPENFHLTGVLESIDGDTAVINGQAFKIDQGTMLDSVLRPGATVTIEFFVLADGTRLAKEIETGESEIEIERENEIEVEHGPEVEVEQEHGPEVEIEQENEVEVEHGNEVETESETHNGADDNSGGSGNDDNSGGTGY